MYPYDLGYGDQMQQFSPERYGEIRETIETAVGLSGDGVARTDVIPTIAALMEVAAVLAAASGNGGNTHLHQRAVCFFQHCINHYAPAAAH